MTLVSGPVAVPDPAGVTRPSRRDRARDAGRLRGRAARRRRRLRRGRRRLARRTAAAQQDQEAARRRRRPCSPWCQNPDILATIAAAGPRRPRLVVGFAAETDDVMANAQAKLRRKGCDWIVANDVSPATGIMGGDENTVHIVTAAGVETWPRWPRTRSPAAWPRASPRP